MEQPGSEPARIEAMGNILSTDKQPSQVGTRLLDRETNTSEVELRTQREET